MAAKQKKLSEILKDTRMSMGKTQPEMAAILGIGERMVRLYESGEYDDVETYVGREKLLQQLDGLSSAGNKKETSHTIAETADYFKTGKVIPVYDAGGSAGPMQMFDDEGEHPAGYIQISEFSDCDFGTFVRGESMWRTYKNGQCVIAKRLNDLDLIPYGSCFLIKTQELRLIKRVVRSKYKGFIRAVSDNQEKLEDGTRIYGDMEIDKKKIIKLWLIRGHYSVDA